MREILDEILISGEPEHAFLSLLGKRIVVTSLGWQ